MTGFNALTPVMKQMKITELLNVKQVADIVPVMLDLPSGNCRKTQPYSSIIGGASISRLILQERGNNA